MNIREPGATDFFGEPLKITTEPLHIACHICGKSARIGSRVSCKNFIRLTGWRDFHHAGGWTCPACAAEKKI